MRSVLFLLAMILATAALAERPDFEELVAKYEEQAIADRRWAHEHAELSMREFETQAWLRESLAAIPGVELVDGEWGTGVVAMLKGGKPGPIVAWRTDMDGLPITEETGLEFSCQRVDTLGSGRVTGVMHACGHDLHMAVALNMTRMLSDVRDEMPGTLLFIGEQAEEIGAGALTLLEAGIFEEGRRPKCVLAIHDHTSIPLGQVGSHPGPSTANVDGFVLKVKGVGGHGAYPHKSVDPVSLAAKMILGFESIVARQMDVNHHCVISVGRIEGGTKSNVIPDEVVLEATVRSLDDETREALPEKIERLVNGIAASVGAPEPELEYYMGTAAGFNNPELVQECREVFRRIIGPENEYTYPAGMGGEDFAYFAREVPGFQFRLGVGRPDREMALHRSNLDIPEKAIAIGMRLAAEVVWEQMAE